MSTIHKEVNNYIAQLKQMEDKLNNKLTTITSEHLLHSEIMTAKIAIESLLTTISVESYSSQLKLKDMVELSDKFDSISLTVSHILIKK